MRGIVSVGMFFDLGFANGILAGQHAYLGLRPHDSSLWEVSQAVELTGDEHRSHNMPIRVIRRCTGGVADAPCTALSP